MHSLISCLHKYYLLFIKIKWYETKLKILVGENRKNYFGNITVHHSYYFQRNCICITIRKIRTSTFSPLIWSKKKIFFFILSTVPCPTLTVYGRNVSAWVGWQLTVYEAVTSIKAIRKCQARVINRFMYSHVRRIYRNKKIGMNIFPL